FDGDGTPDIGGPAAAYATWGESLGGILSGIHGAIDPAVKTAVPGSGGGSLSDIGIRSFQGGVPAAVMLRLWGPLVVSMPASEPPTCKADPNDKTACTVCGAMQASLRWIVPNVNGAGEIEIACVDAGAIQNTTVVARDRASNEVRCARVGDDLRLRIGLPA